MIKINKEIKLPNYVVQALCNCADYVNRSKEQMDIFRSWVVKNVDENFNFEYLTATSYNEYDERYEVGDVTQEITEIEYGNTPNEESVETIEHVLNMWVQKHKDKDGD